MIRFFEWPLTERELAVRGERLVSEVRLASQRFNWSRDEVRAWQQERLLDLISYAYESIPFYRRKYHAAGFHPSQVRGLEDLALIPITTKDELRRCDRALLQPEGGFHDSRFVMTSGSTGMPVGLYRSEDSLYRFTASAMLLYCQWCRYEPLTRVLYFLDSKPHNLDYALADLLRTTVMEDRIISTFEHTPLLVQKLSEFQPEYISSYPTTMRNLAAYLRGQNRTHEEVKLLHLTSEMLDSATKRLLEQVFPQARIVQTYTSTEAGLMGFECPTDGGFHIVGDQVLCEISGDGSITLGTGRLIVTDLVNRATPIIRYEGLGDLAALSSKPCRCGSALPRIEGLEGRIVGSIRLQDGATLSPYALTNVIAELPGITGYQIIQHSLMEFQVKIAIDSTAGGAAPDLETLIAKAFTAILGRGATLRMTVVDIIMPPPGAHKVPLVISHVPNAD